MLLWALVALFPVTARAADRPVGQPLEKVTIVYAGISGNQAPGWVAYEAGIFRKYGLDVQLVHVVGGPRAVQTLLSGDALIAQVSGLPVLQSNLQGSGIVFIAGILNTMNYQFIVDKSIQQPDQLKGKAVAVSRFGGSSDFATRFALDKYGLIPEKDVAVLEIGSQPDRFAALEAGRIQGVMLEVPLTLKAKKMGFRVLADLQMLGLEYQSTGVAATRALIKSRPELVRNVMKAYVEAIHYYKTHRKESLAILQKYLKTDDMEALTETYEGIGLTLVPEKPYPTLQGVEIMRRELAAKDPKAREAKAEQFVDLTFVRELDTSGFIDRLYKSTVASAKETPPVPSKADVKGQTVKPETSGGSRKRVEARPPIAKTIPANAAQEYAIQAGDTLSHLARRQYGSAQKWPRIYEANRHTIKNPHYIYIGQKILIPPDDAKGA
jgi:NitT/TauT family transport system substrate-binding protein